MISRPRISHTLGCMWRFQGGTAWKSYRGLLKLTFLTAKQHPIAAPRRASLSSSRKRVLAPNGIPAERIARYRFLMHIFEFSASRRSRKVQRTLQDSQNWILGALRETSSSQCRRDVTRKNDHFKYHCNRTPRTIINTRIILLPHLRKVSPRGRCPSHSWFVFDLFYLVKLFCNATKTVNIFSYLLNIYMYFFIFFLLEGEK